jgi:hypothetical protein
MNRKTNIERERLVCFLVFLSAFVNAQSSIEYDIVLSGGRVIDPETKLDTIKNVGITRQANSYQLGRTGSC